MTEIRLRGEDVFWRVIDGEVVALDAATSRYMQANPSATALWEMLVDGATEDALVEALCGRFKVSPETARADVKAFVGELASRGLIES
jgi:hypothetical protein